MNVDTASDRGGAELVKTDRVVVGGGQQASSFYPPTMALDGEEDGPEKASKPVVKFQSNLGDDGEELCRICHMSGEIENPLYYPCACSGSIKFTHEDCLLQWLNHRKNQLWRNNMLCEICKHAFVFQPVYAENTPSRLPLQELLLGMALKAARRMHSLTRLLIVLSVWFLVIPFTTSWMWRFTSVRSFSEAHKLFISRCTLALLLLDCLYGIFFLAAYVFVLAGLPIWEVVAERIRVRLQEDVRAEEDEVIVRAEREHLEEVHGPVRMGALQEPNVQLGGDNDQLRPEQGLHERPDLLDLLVAILAVRFQAVVLRQILGVPFEELENMHFPVLYMLKRAITMLVIIAIPVSLVALVPFTLGRMVMSVFFCCVFVTTTGATDMMPFNTMSLTRGNTSVGNGSAILPGNDLLLIGSAKSSADGSAFDGVASGYIGYVGHDGPDVAVAAFQQSNAATFALGYGLMLLVLSLGLGLRALLKYRQREPSLAKQVMAGVKYMAITVKVAIVLLVRLGVLILFYGWWLDICTLGILNVSIAQRTELFWASPFTSSLLHWLVGIVYRLQISNCTRLIREALGEGVLDILLQYITDSNYTPFRILNNAPIHGHTRRILFSFVIHGNLIVMLVFLPVQLAILIAPSMWPLEISVSDLLMKIAGNITLYNFLGAVAVNSRLCTVIATGLFYWISMVGWALGLRELLLPDPEERNIINNQQERAPMVQEGQDHSPDRDRNLAQAALDEQIKDSDPKKSLIGQECVEDNLEGEQGAEFEIVLRIVVLLIAACVTIIAVNSAMIVVSVALGRWILSDTDAAQGSKSDDINAINTGFISLLDSLLICYDIQRITAAVRYIRTLYGNVVREQVLKWSAIVAKSAALVALWVILIPALIGLLLELLVIVPIQVPVEKCPVPIFYVYQDWASRWTLGFEFLTAWMGLVMLGEITPLANENWRLRFLQVWADGFANLRGCWVLKEIITPILARLLMALCVPLAFARWMFPSLGYSLIVNSAVDRYTWLGSLGIVVLWYGSKRMQQWLSDLHNSIRDDRYLIGKKLHNFGNNA